MIIKRIKGANVDVAKDQPQYRTVPAKVEIIEYNGVRVRQFSSAYEFTPDELEKINKGAPLILVMITPQMVPHRLKVGEVPDENSDEL